MQSMWCDYCDGNGCRYDVNEAILCKHCSGTGHASTNYYGSDDIEEQERRRKQDTRGDYESRYEFR